MKSIFSLWLLGLFSVQLNAQVRPEWQEWAKNNTHELSLSDSLNYDDLKVLDQLVGNKRVVFLGENSHGISEFTSLKSRLVKYLHEKHQFNVIAFESNPCDAHAANLRVNELSTLDLMHQSIWENYHVEEAVPLFRYIKQSHQNNSPLHVAGIGIPLSTAGNEFSRYLANLIRPISEERADALFRQDSSFSIQAAQMWCIGNLLSPQQRKKYKESELRHLKVYEALSTYLEKSKKLFADTNEVNHALFYISTRVDYIHWRAKDSTYMAQKLGLGDRKWSLRRIASTFRDFQMSTYLKYLAQKEYPNQKIIVWAADDHIRKIPNRMPNQPFLQDDCYVMGLFSYTGKGSGGHSFDSAHPDFTYTFQKKEDSLAIEDIIHSTGKGIGFMDMQNAQMCTGNSWMFELCHYYEWRGDEPHETHNLRDVFDGIIVIKKVNPPTYLDFNYSYFKDP